MLTNVLDVIGATLIVVGCGVVFGLGAALLAAGGASLAISWALTTKGGSRS